VPVRAFIIEPERVIGARSSLAPSEKIEVYLPSALLVKAMAKNSCWKVR
jgi:hypothetical protein